MSKKARITLADIKRGLQMAAKAQPAEALVRWGAEAAILVRGPLETHSFNRFSLESSFTEIRSNPERT